MAPGSVPPSIRRNTYSEGRANEGCEEPGVVTHSSENRQILGAFGQLMLSGLTYSPYVSIEADISVVCRNGYKLTPRFKATYERVLLRFTRLPSRTCRHSQRLLASFSYPGVSLRVYTAADKPLL